VRPGRVQPACATRIDEIASRVAGPMRLLGGDLPDKAFMRSIIEHNLNQVLALVR
jgi:hypothetical protein